MIVRSERPSSVVRPEPDSAKKKLATSASCRSAAQAAGAVCSRSASRARVWVTEVVNASDPRNKIGAMVCRGRRFWLLPRVPQPLPWRATVDCWS
jgi:hypothetical protein